MISHEGILEFFVGAVRQGVDDSGVEIDDDVNFYVVRLLVDMGTSPLDEGPFGVRLLSSGEPPILRSIGDGTLFLSGFFPERLARKGLRRDYLSSLGSSAYGALSSKVPPAARPLYLKLSKQFISLQNLLETVRGGCDAAGMDQGTAALKWLQNRSPILERRLGELGVTVGKNYPILPV